MEHALPPLHDIKLGFATQLVTLSCDNIILLRKIEASIRETSKYQCILASVKEIGIVEPPVVTPSDQGGGKYILLNGHLRLEALKELGETEVMCLLSTDDEAFTYNKHINRLAPIQEHLMILRAVERGVSEHKIAKVLNCNVESIIRKRNLLDGICNEAAELLQDKSVAAGVFPLLKRMKRERQMEVATLMNDAGIYSVTYANALLAATPQDQLVESKTAKKVKGLDDAQMARMENEMESVGRQYRLIEETYRADVLNLTLTRGYIKNLLENARVLRYLMQQHPEMLKQFQEICEMKRLSDAA